MHKDKHKPHDVDGNGHKPKKHETEELEETYDGYWWPVAQSATVSKITGVAITPTAVGALPAMDADFEIKQSQDPNPQATLTCRENKSITIGENTTFGTGYLGSRPPTR